MKSSVTHGTIELEWGGKCDEAETTYWLTMRSRENGPKMGAERAEEWARSANDDNKRPETRMTTSGQ